MGVHLQFCVAVHNCTETTMYKIQLQLWSDIFSAPHLSTGASMNQLQANTI